MRSCCRTSSKQVSGDSKYKDGWELYAQAGCSEFQRLYTGSLSRARRSRVVIQELRQVIGSRSSDSGLFRLLATNPGNSGRPVGRPTTWYRRSKLHRTSLLVFGLVLAIIFMSFFATVIMKVLTKHSWLCWAGLLFLIYLSFALLSMHWIPLVVLLFFIISIWIPNMIKKDNSLSKYENFKNYKNKTRVFLPF